MINRLAISIVRKNNNLNNNLTIGLYNLKLTHLFSDNGKNPFDKFKRKQNNDNKPNKQVNINEKQSKQNQKITQKKQKNIDNFQNEQSSKKQSSFLNKDKKQIPGFSKFKRDQNFENKLKITPIKQSKQINKHQQQKVQKQNNEKKKEQPLMKSESNQSQNIEIKGFNRFRKVKKTPEPIKQQKQNKKQQKQQKIQSSINNSKLEDTQNLKEKAQKKTEKKNQEDTQEWQRFLQEQIKKQKQKKTESKKSQGWRNFDFTNKSKNNQKKTHEQQKIPKNENVFFKGPWTPTKVMRALLFGGLGIYLGSSFISQLISYDNSRLIQTSQLIDYLKKDQIRQTWFMTTVQSLSQDSNRTKKYACATLNSGQVVKSQSNNDFEIQWAKMIHQHNTDAALFGLTTPVLQKVPIIKKDSHIFNSIRSVLSFALLFMFIRSIMAGVAKGKGQLGKGGFTGLAQNSKSHRFRQNINVKFADVVGMNKAKQQIVEFIDFLKNSQKYNKLGAKIPRGALLTGPPGTGKTMLAKACAGQSGVPFFTISGSQFMEMYVGVGAQRVRNLFKQAKQAAPSIIFIDQIDAVGKKRSSGAGGGNDQRDNTLNQLLVQMDGFDQKSNVIVFAATNQKQILDPALTRPGRFDRLIQVDLPDIQGRKQIFMVHLKPIVLDQKYQVQDYAKRLATLTPGFSGADIKNLCNQAAIIAARNDKSSVSMIDFELASQRIIGGVQKKSTLITPQTKRTVAYHQCGHGVVSWFMEHASPLLKLTIIPRSKGALGYAQYLPNQNQVYTRKQLQDQICVILGGRITQQIFFGKISTGASDDLQKAHKVTKAIITQYGMSDKLSWLSYGETQYTKQYSHQTQQKIDQEIIQIIRKCSIRTRAIINEKEQMIKKLAELLLKQETIDQRMIQSILGQRPFKSSKQYQQYIRQRQKLDQENDNQQPKKLPQNQNLTSAFKQVNKKSDKFSMLY